MEPIRIKNSYDTFLGEFKNEILLECNICNSISTLKNKKIVCTKCGFNKNLDNENYIITLHNGEDLESQFYNNSNSKNVVKLWFSADCCNQVLWAYNRKHLLFLKEHVEATLRERNGDEYCNKSIGSRLPKWILSKKNRENILKTIDKLNNK